MKRTVTAGRRFSRVVVEIDAASVTVDARADESIAGAVRRIAPRAVERLQAAGLHRGPHGWLEAALRAARPAEGSPVHVADASLSRAARIADLAEALRAAPRLPYGTAERVRELLEAAFALGRECTLDAVYGADEAAQTRRARAQRQGNPLRAELVEALALHRRAGRTLDEALVALQDATHGVRVQREGGGKDGKKRMYRITSSCAREVLVRARCTLERAWADAAKAQPRRRRTRD